MIDHRIGRLVLAFTLFFAAAAAPLHAEPYFAVMTGQKCAACHVNQTGGGKRTEFGNIFAQTQLAARTPPKIWDGKVMEYLAIGGNVRANATAVTTDNTEDTFDFDLDEALVYLEVPLLADRLTFYVDQQVGPNSLNREAFALLRFPDANAYLKAGKMFLPFGWRLEDDSEFIRQVPGINYTTPDDGIEGGMDIGQWTLQLALTNGSAGGAETNRGKQWSALASYVQANWRIGASANYNDADDDSRTMYGGFAGLKTGPVSWLGEIDFISDDALGPDGRDQWTSFVEANWWIHKGHNLKATYGWFDPDDDVDEDERARYSLVYEWFPFAFTQLRAGIRSNDGIPQNDAQNSDIVFVQLHAFF
jgi:hypothetical protein